MERAEWAERKLREFREFREVRDRASTLPTLPTLPKKRRWTLDVRPKIMQRAEGNFVPNKKADPQQALPVLCI